MRKIYTIAFCSLALSAVGQQQHARPLHPSEKHGPNTPAVRQSDTGRDRGTAFYLETFDNDLNGWTSETAVGQVDWKWTNTGPGPTTSLYPVPPLNSSTPSGWAIIDDDFDGVNGASTNAYLISPVIDLSGVGTPYLKVEFDQYFQEFQLDTTFVGVSTDGGATWNEALINEEVGRDGRPNPELVDVDITEWVAADPSNVRIRFRYVATWDYGWQVDNIAIRELPANDMAILRASSTAFDYENTGFGFMDYSVYPQAEVTAMVPSAVIKNKGYLDQTGVELTVSVEGPDGPEQTTQSASSTYAPTTEATLIADAFTPSGVIGNYTMTFSIEQNESDEVPANNTIVKTFAVSQNIYAHDDGATQSFLSQGVDTETEPYEMGHHFALVNDGQLIGVQVAVHETTPVGTMVHGALYNPSDAVGEHPSLIEFTNDYEVTEADLNGPGDANFITMLFGSPQTLVAGQVYLLMAGTYDGEDGLTFAYSGSSEAQISIIHYPDLSEDFEFYVTRTPMVRMVLAGGVGLDEHAHNGVALTGNVPNPFSTTTTIDFELRNTENATLLIHDISGKEVMVQPLGQRTAGENRYVLDAAHLAPGIYTYTVQTPSARTSKRMVVAR